MFFKAFNTYISYLRNSNLNTARAHTGLIGNIYLRCDRLKKRQDSGEKRMSSILNGIVVLSAYLVLLRCPNRDSLSLFFEEINHKKSLELGV